ncbi:MAG: PIN domain-containing protein [Thermoplasmata archaeon]
MERQKGHRRHRRVRETPAKEYAAEGIPEPTAGGEGLAGVLLDTDVIIQILRGHRRFIDSAESIPRSGSKTYCCAVSFAEVYGGIRPGEEALTDAFFGARGEVVIDSTTGRRAGAYMARYAKSHSLDIADALIAAAASTSGLRLWTLNRKHYPMTDVDFWEAG